jgi:nitroreductase
MEKPAITQYEIHPILKNRWSPRSFTNRPVPKESLQRILEAARWTPSSFNEQPWRFIVGIKGEKTWDMIYETLVEFNQKWAKLAPVLIMSVGSKILSKNDKPNKMYIYDVGQSVSYITFQAMHEGLRVHQMGGFSAEKAIELFNIPNDFQPLTVIAIGYQGDPELLDNDLKKTEIGARSRKELKVLVYDEKFGNTSAIFSKSSAILAQ